MLEALAVGVGAGLGAVLRSLLDVSPWAILGINVLGSFLMGFFRPPKFWGTGFLGGFTSYSAYVVAISNGALLIATLTIIGCIAAYVLGSMRWAS